MAFLLLRWKLIITLGCALLVMVGLGLFSIQRIAMVEAAVLDVRDHWLPSSVSLNKFVQRAERARSLVAVMFLTEAGDARLSEAAQAAAMQAASEKARLEYAPLVRTGEERKLAEAIDLSWSKYLAADKRVIALELAGQDKAALALYLGEAGHHFVRFHAAVQDGLDFNEKGGIQAANRGEQVYQSTRTMIIAGALVGALLWTIAGLALVVTDAQRRGVDRTLRESQDRFRVIFSSVNEGIFIDDPNTGKFVDVNQSTCDMFGYSREELVGSDIEFISSGIPPYSQSEAMDWLGKARTEGPQTFEWQCKAKDGHLFWSEVALRYVKFGDSEWVLATLRDISERKQLDLQILQMAHYDGLTGLANRRFFMEKVDEAIARMRRGGKDFAALYLDLDFLKDVNDTLGHPVGDLLLTSVAQRLKAGVRNTDTVARFGGDEFAVLVTDIDDPSDVALLADSLLKTLREPFLLQGNTVNSGASMGIAVYGFDTFEGESLMSHADLALYRAKSERRGTYRFFTDAMDAEARMRVALISQLRQAISADQFFLLYQPQVDAGTGRILGVEALVRWRHPQRGVIGPGEFVPVAEKSGLIGAIGSWVMLEACRQMKQWLDAGIAPALIGVNVSAIQFKMPLELEANIAAILAETGVPAHLLELELTESAVMGASSELNEVLARLKEKGLRFAIDDFGTGYSSLDYLNRFQFARIKIAPNFSSSKSSRAIVKAAIGMAHELGLDVMVEGVETAEELRRVRSWGCDQIQGFYFAKPMSAAEATSLLRVGSILREPLLPLDAVA